MGICGDGLVGKIYSWNDDESLARDYANFDGTGGKISRMDP